MTRSPEVEKAGLHDPSTNALTIGICLANGDFFAYPAFQFLLAGIGYRLASQPYDFLLTTPTPHANTMASFLQRVDGILWLESMMHPDILAMTQTYPQVVFGDPEWTESHVPRVAIDYTAGMSQLINHFVTHGHQRIGLVLSSVASPATEALYAGYKSALAKHNFAHDSELIVRCPPTPNNAQQAADSLLDQPSPVTAIIVGNNHLAAHITQALQSHPLQGSIDVAAVGPGNHPAAQTTQPPLITLHSPLYEAGELLGTLLLAQINGQPLTQTTYWLKPALVMRASG